MSPRRPTLSLNQRIIISLTLLAIAVTIATAFIAGHDWIKPPTPTLSSGETEYVGRVLDSNDLHPIEKAKVTLDLQGAPLIAYTDTEGYYQFRAAVQSKLSGQIRVDANGYPVYIRTISLSPSRTTLEEIRLTAPTPLPTREHKTPLPPSGEYPDEYVEIRIIDVQASTGSLAPVDSSDCLWTEASGQGAALTLTLEPESTVHHLRIALYEPFVQKISLTFSDATQQIVELGDFRDYAYQKVELQPVKTTSISVEVLQVKNNSLDNFGICHIQVFGTIP